MEPVADLAGPVITPVAAPLVETLAPLVVPTVEAAAPLLDTVAPVSAPVLAAVEPVVQPVLAAFQPAVAPALDALPTREREILRLRFEEGLTQTQIAERFDISQMHVSRLIRKSLEQMRRDLT